MIRCLQRLYEVIRKHLKLLIGTFVVVFLSLQATKYMKRARRNREQSILLRHNRIKCHQDMAEALEADAIGYLDKAKSAKERAEQQLEEIGHEDETLESLIDRFNAPHRVHPDTADNTRH